jgi:hypothetical protein
MVTGVPEIGTRTIEPGQTSHPTASKKLDPSKAKAQG